MKVYHGSIELFENINLNYCKDKKDFGKGIYITEYIEIAKWALANKQLSIIRGNRNTKAYLYRFLVDMECAKRELSVHMFNDDSIEWLDYIINNRTLKEKGNDYDIVVGKIAYLQQMTVKEVV